MEELFAYGTLMEPVIQKKVIGRIIQGCPDVLSGYKKSLKEFCDGIFPVIVIQELSCVSGIVIELSSDELKRCDEYEGSGYFRFRVSLESGRIVWVYNAVDNKISQ